MSIKERLENIKLALPKHTTLVAVSKTKPIDEIMVAYNVGHRIFGENKVQEMTDKYELMPKDIKWHMIGHVQRNKVKYMAEFVDLIHGVDSLKLLKEINKQGEKVNRTINCLLQIKIAEEDRKFGLSVEDAKAILNSESFQSFENVHISGLMGMATFTEDQEQVEREFQFLKDTFEEFKTFDLPNYTMKTLSMGMSGDYKLAVDCGSTMVRIGSIIFGERNYN